MPQEAAKSTTEKFIDYAREEGLLAASPCLDLNLVGYQTRLQVVHGNFASTVRREENSITMAVFSEADHKSYKWWRKFTEDSNGGLVCVGWQPEGEIELCKPHLLLAVLESKYAKCTLGPVVPRARFFFPLTTLALDDLANETAADLIYNSITHDEPVYPLVVVIKNWDTFLTKNKRYLPTEARLAIEIGLNDLREGVRT